MSGDTQKLFRIAVDLMVNENTTAGPLDAFLRSLKETRAELRDAKGDARSFASTLGKAARQADALRKAMEGAADAARNVATASAGIRVPAASMPQPAPAYASVPAAQSAGGLTPPPPPPPPKLMALPTPPSPPVPPPGGGALVPVPVAAPPPSGAREPIPLNFGSPPGSGGGGGGAGGGGRPRAPLVTPMRFIGAEIGWHVVKKAFESGADVDDIKAMMAAVYVAGADGKPVRGFTDKQIAQADGEALQMQRDTPGLSYADGLKIILQTASNLGSASDGLAAAPKLGRYSQVLSRLGRGDAIAQVEAAVQAGEIKGLNGADGKIDIAKEIDFVARLTRTAVSMGGTFDMQKYLTGFKQFGAGADAASMDFATAILPAYMKVMGETKTGTAADSLQAVMFAPVPKTRADHYAKEQERLGLRNKDGSLDKGQAALLSKDENAYFQTEVLPRLFAAGFTDPTAISQEIRRLFPRATVDRLGITSIKDRDLLAKEISRNEAQQAAGDTPLDKLLHESPGNQFKAFAESLKTLEAVTTDAAMKPTMDILQKLSGVLLNVSQYVKDHPEGIERFGKDVDRVLDVLLAVADFVKNHQLLFNIATGNGGSFWSGGPLGVAGHYAGKLFGQVEDSDYTAAKYLGAHPDQMKKNPKDKEFFDKWNRDHQDRIVRVEVVNAHDLASATTHGIASGLNAAPVGSPAGTNLSVPQYPGKVN